MRRTFAIILAVSLCISLCACGNNTGTSQSAVAQKADELILAIGEVSADSERMIIAAEVYYDTLSESEKKQVENYSVLLDAIKSLEEIQSADNSELTVLDTIECEMGKTIQIDGLEFTLTDIQFANNLASRMNEGFLRPLEPASQNSGYIASDGNVLVSFSYILKNTGKNEYNIGQSKCTLDVVYGDGYTFSKELDADYRYIDGSWSKLYPDLSLIAPLTEKVGRGYLEVPLEVYENTEETLKVNVNLAVETEGRDNCDFRVGTQCYKKKVLSYILR